MIKPGNGGCNVGGDCEKGLGSRYCLGLCLQARVREIWQIGRGIVRDFLRRSGKGNQLKFELTLNKNYSQEARIEWPPVLHPGVVVGYLLRG